MNKVHDVGELTFEGDRLRVRIDGKEHTFDLEQISPRLLRASREQRMKYEVSPAGYGIRWPLIDEDLSIDGLLGITHQPSQQADRVRRSH
jgi:hypothetical protein